MRRTKLKLKPLSRSSANHLSWKKIGIFHQAVNYIHYLPSYANFRFCYYLGGTADAATGNLGAMSKPLSWGMPRFLDQTILQAFINTTTFFLVIRSAKSWRKPTDRSASWHMKSRSTSAQLTLRSWKWRTWRRSCLNGMRWAPYCFLAR